jgi:hypothetical protein
LFSSSGPGRWKKASERLGVSLSVRPSAPQSLLSLSSTAPRTTTSRSTRHWPRPRRDLHAARRSAGSG